MSLRFGRRLALRALLIACVVVTGACHAENQLHTDVRGGYAIRFPGKPKITTGSANRQGFTLLEGNATLRTESVTFLVDYTDYAPGPINSTSAESIFTLLTEGAVGAGTLQQSTTIQQSSLKGREIIYLNPNSHVIRMRYILSRRRVFQVGVECEAGKEHDDKILAFLDSFTPLGRYAPRSRPAPVGDVETIQLPAAPLRGRR